MDVTREAREKLQEFLEGNDEAFVRVARITAGGPCCAKLTLGVTMDEECDEENDLLFTLDGLPVVIEKELYASLKDVRISFDEGNGIVVSGGG